LAEQYLPELHVPTLRLMEGVARAHAAGSGTISLLEVIELFQLGLSRDDQARLRRRGGLAITKTGERGGTFESRGDELRLDVGGQAITVPAVLQGTYCSDADGTELVFHTGATVYVAKLLFIEIGLASIRADSTHIDIHLRPGIHQRYRHAPPE